MGALGILAALGGAGRGYMMGKQFVADQQQEAAKTALLQQQQQENQNNLDLQQAIKDAANDAANQPDTPDTNTIQSQKASVLNSQSADASGQADVAAAPGTTGPIDPTAASLVSQANSPDPGQPTVGGIAFDMTQGKKVLSPEPQTVASPTAGSPVDLSASPGIRALPANVPTAADQPSPMLHDPITDQNNTFQRMAPKLAQIALQHGRGDLAQSYMKMADDAEMNNYTRAWQGTMRTLATGNDQAAATAISNLYNLGFPDAKHVDIQPLGQGQFKVLQYDTSTGQQINGGVIDRNTMMQYGETLLNPSERVKLQVERENAAKSLQVSQNQLTAQMLHNQTLENVAGMKGDSSLSNIMAMIAAGRWAPKGSGGDSSVADQKRTDQLVKQSAVAVNGLAKSKAIPADGQAEIAASAAKYVTDAGMDPQGAANQATKDYQQKQSDQTQALNTHIQTVKGAMSSWPTMLGGTSDDAAIRQTGDPAAVKLAASMSSDGKLTLPNYQKAAQQIVKRGGTLTGPAAAVAATVLPPPSRASTTVDFSQLPKRATGSP